MPRKKSNKFLGVFKIFFSSIKSYFLYLDEGLKLLAFPVLGQILSIILIFTITYYFNSNVDSIREINPFFDDDKNLLITLLVILLPFLVILIKAIYDYLIAFCSLNLLFFTNSNKKKTKNIDLKANNAVISRKIWHYIVLLFLVTILLITPPLIFVAPIIWIFLCLSFQVFALEGDVSGPKAISRSIELVKGNVIPTIILLLLCTIFTMFFCELFVWGADKISLSYFFVNRWEAFFNALPLEEWNEMLSKLPFEYSLDGITLSRFAVDSAIGTLIWCFTLPFRCCAFTELYKMYDADKIKEISKDSEEIIQRATEKKGKNE